MCLSSRLGFFIDVLDVDGNRVKGIFIEDQISEGQIEVYF